jgi:hypothetical protein
MLPAGELIRSLRGIGKCEKKFMMLNPRDRLFKYNLL